MEGEGRGVIVIVIGVVRVWFLKFTFVCREKESGIVSACLVESKVVGVVVLLLA